MAKYLYFTRYVLAVCVLAAVCVGAVGQDLSSFKGQRPLAFSGSFQAGTSFYGAQGIAGRRSPFAWKFGFGVGQCEHLRHQCPVFGYFQRPQFVIQLSCLSAIWPQPFLTNGYVCTPAIAICLFLSTRSTGFPFRAGLGINPGKLRFAAMYGRLETQDFSLRPN